MIQRHKTLLYVSGISLFLQFLNGRVGRLFLSTWKSREGALIRAGTLIMAGALIRDNTVNLIELCSEQSQILAFSRLNGKSFRNE